METRLVRLNGIPFRIPAKELPGPHSAVAPGGCFADEPGNVYGGAVCTLPPHATGPDGITHIGHDDDGQVIAIWGDPAAVTGREL